MENIYQIEDNPYKALKATMSNLQIMVLMGYLLLVTEFGTKYSKRVKIQIHSKY